MYSIDFPKMFDSAKTRLVKDHDATTSNVKLLLQSERRTLFGDPDFGVRLRTLLYENNTTIIQDLVIDEIYTTLLAFMPQLKITRDNIKITSDGVDIYANIRCLNLLDYTIDMYNIKLTEQKDSE